MNIFYTDPDPQIAAQNMVDKHVVKMILESAQLLSTAHRLLDGSKKTQVVVTRGGKEKKKVVYFFPDERETGIYSLTHQNHPSAIWCRESTANYNWLYEHMMALGEEYTFRYGKVHKTIRDNSKFLSSPPKNLRKTEFTLMPSCMDQAYIISRDPIVNYRNYYKFGKSNLHKWTNREPPVWIL